MTATLAPTTAAASTLLWPHQTRYRDVAQRLAQDLFNALDEELQPLVLLLALPTNPSQPVRCLEPGNCELPLAHFADAVARGRVIQQATPGPYAERDDVAPATIRSRHEGIGLRLALQETFDQLAEGGHHQHFAGRPVQIGGHFVVTVLRLRRKPLRAYPTLRPLRYYTDGRPLASSLAMAAMYRFHEECVKALSEPEPGAGLISRPRESEELLRSAGRTFHDTPAQSLGFDPATSSAPFVATLVDVTGLVIYFSFALLFLRGTLL